MICTLHMLVVIAATKPAIDRAIGKQNINTTENYENIKMEREKIWSNRNDTSINELSLYWRLQRWH